MVQRIGGLRRKSRNKFKKKPRKRGKTSIKNYLEQYENGDIVQLVIDPSNHKGVFHPRFHNRIGKIVSESGRCYKVRIKDRNKVKDIIAHPSHLKRVKQDEQ